MCCLFYRLAMYTVIIMVSLTLNWNCTAGELHATCNPSTQFLQVA